MRCARACSRVHSPSRELITHLSAEQGRPAATPLHPSHIHVAVPPPPPPPPLAHLFPGTCVNNEYVVQFKKGVFELGVPINPVAIKYNKVRGRG